MAEYINKSEIDRQTAFLYKLKEINNNFYVKHGRKPLANTETYGCQQNENDTERIRGMLRDAGYDFCTSAEEADLVIYNTCAVRENAEDRVYGRLGILKHIKQSRPDMIIGLCGCMVQQEHIVEKIKKIHNHVDLIFGTHALYKLPELLYDTVTEKRTVIDTENSDGMIAEDMPIMRESSNKAWVSIMYGCNNFCSYCIVPYVRGRERSRKPEKIIEEIKQLVADGVTEICLLGQNVNSYGKGLKENITFAQLLKRVTEIDKIKRVRFMTSHPKDLSDELIEVMASSDKVCRHLHLPVQSGSSRILKQMNRSYTREQYLTLVDKIRNRIPDIALTTDIIVGFPGETEEDFNDTMDMVEQVRYDAAFTFIYSKRTGTPAAAMTDTNDKAVINERYQRLIKRVQEISAEKIKGLTGQVLPVLVEGKSEENGSLLTGRLSNNTLVHFVGCESLIGKIIDVKLVESKGFYYMGEAVI